jgi:hypothetical protein
MTLLTEPAGGLFEARTTTQPDSPKTHSWPSLAPPNHHAKRALSLLLEGSGHTEEVPGPANCPFWTLSLLGPCRRPATSRKSLLFCHYCATEMKRVTVLRQGAGVDDNWHYATAGTGTRGPISKSDLGHVLRTEPFAWVWCPGMTDWAQAADVPALRDFVNGSTRQRNDEATARQSISDDGQIAEAQGHAADGPINRTPPEQETSQNHAPGPKSSPGPSKFHKRDIAQIVADNPEKSNCALARELGVNESTVRRARRAIGVTPEQDIANLNPMGCKWPTGQTHDGTLTFCGAQRLIVGAKPYPYCEKHCHAAYPASTHLTK